MSLLLLYSWHESVYSYGLSHLESYSATKFQPPTKQTLCSGPFMFTLSQQWSDLFSPHTQRHAYFKSVHHLYPVTVMICKGRHRGSTWPGPKWDENSTSIRTSDGNQESAQGPWSVPVFGPDYLVMGAAYRSVLNLLSCLQTRLICIKHVFRIQNQADESILPRLNYTSRWERHRLMVLLGSRNI